VIHFVKNIPIEEDIPQKFKQIIVGAGCFWGVEKIFWDIDGVYLTSVGYSGGNTINPTYEDVCYKKTNHAEVVKIVYDPSIIELNKLLKIFWECHDPTQGMRQGNDVGTQYRSTIYASDEDDLNEAIRSKEIYQSELIKNNFNKITTDIEIAPEYYLAEEYHQQYLAKNPNGYCGIGGTGCSFPNE
tara:strand:+ start:794 stop:1351 length:558 start_codon:yes stop_codon:yes gene_type:complete